MELPPANLNQVHPVPKRKTKAAVVADIEEFLENLDDADTIECYLVDITPIPAFPHPGGRECD